MFQFVISVLYFTIIGLFAVCIFTLTKWGGRLHAYLFFYCVANLVYNCGYILVMHSDNKNTYVTALKLGYLGRVWVGLSMFLFIAELCGVYFPVWVKTTAAIINMVIYFFILNLENTHLYYKTMEFVMDGDFPTLPHSGGPLYYMFTMINLLYSIMCLYIIFRAYIREKNETAKKRNLVMSIALTLMGASYVIYFFKIIPLARKFDVMIIAYAICTAFMLLAIIKYRMLDATAAAKNYVVDEMSEGIIVFDAQDRLSYYNKPAQKLFPELEDPDKKDDKVRELLDDFDSAIKSGEPVRLDGKVFTPRVNPLTEEGTSIGTLYSLSDDSEHYRHMDELREQKRIADDANEAKSQFLTNMSHEIRTPINAVLGLNEMISRECGKVKELDEGLSPAVSEALGNIGVYSGNIENAGNNLLSIVNDILDISKIEAGKMELVNAPYSLSSLLNEVNGLIAFKVAEKGLEFVMDADETLPDELYGDKVRVRQIMINILTNAVKYTDKGTVWLTVKGRSGGFVKEGGILNLSIMVRDTGIGIRREDMDRLFGTFERLELERNSTIEGTGLGLAITRQLLTMMGGNITVDSEYGEGSTFMITIPQKVVSTEPVGDVRAGGRNAGSSKQPYRVSFTSPASLILVVDDTKVNLLVAKALLRDTKIRIDTAGSGKQAIDLTKKNHYDLILMDQRMPNMDGTEALNNIRNQEEGLNVETPVICMTADAVIGAKERYIAEGFDDYLSKPIDSNELEQTLLKYLPKEKISDNDK
ncbi:MAG: response regulator [Lachnospiraceae bacterium]|nr:response regulator [Lachnospiraceae bacterium]